MDMIIQLIVSGVAMGFIYALIAIEYTLIFNSSRLLNFAHTSIITLGAYFFAYSFVRQSGLTFWLSAVFAGIVMMGVGFFISGAIFAPLRKIPSTFAMFATMMFGLIIIEIINILFDPRPFQLKGFLNGTTRIFGAVISKANVWIICVAAIVVTLLLLFMHKTKTGKAMRCVAENRDTAEYMGINAAVNVGITVALSCLICTVIGILIIPLYSVKPWMVGTLGLKGFAASIVGSFGSVPGAIVGGIIVGLLENFAVMVLPAVYKDVTAFALVLVMLMIKPNGIFGGFTEKRLVRLAQKEQRKEASNNG